MATLDRLTQGTRLPSTTMGDPYADQRRDLRPAAATPQATYPTTTQPTTQQGYGPYTFGPQTGTTGGALQRPSDNTGPTSGAAFPYLQAGQTPPTGFDLNQYAKDNPYVPYTAALPNPGTEAIPYLEQLFQQYGQQFMGPTNTGQLYGQLQGMGPSNSQGYYDANSAFFGSPGALEALYASAGGQYGQQTPLAELWANNPYAQALASEGLGAQAQSMLGGQGAMDAFWSQYGMGQVQQPSELAQQGQRLDQGFSGANYLQQFGARQQGNLEGPGALEQFAASSLSGTNPYYKLLGEEGRAAIDQAAIARGAYGSGGSLGALAKYQANLDAQNFRDQAQLQQAAQGLQLQRLGLGADVAGRSSAERIGQFGALQGLYGQQFDDRMQALGLGITGASATDASNVNRLAGLVNATTAGDQVALARLAGQTGLARDTTNSALDWLNSQFAQAGAAQNAALDRTMAGMGAAGAADSANLGRMNLLADVAGQSDVQGLNRLNSMFGAAGAAQGAAQQRVDSAFQNDLGKYLSGLITNVYNNAGNLSGEAEASGINATIDRYRQMGAGDIAQNRLFWDLMNRVTNNGGGNEPIKGK